MMRFGVTAVSYLVVAAALTASFLVIPAGPGSPAVGGGGT